MSDLNKKRYQVFISSTYDDLVDERQEVLRTLLQMNCIPVGMELFPASNDDQWSLIKRIIDESDYFIIIVGGKYGSEDASGIGYTEKEYRYAVEIGMPVLGFVFKDPDLLPANKIERRESQQEKLSAFRSLVLSKFCRFWTTPSDLSAAVSTSLTQVFHSHPAEGWVRNSIASSLISPQDERDTQISISLVEDKVPSAKNEIVIDQYQLHLWDTENSDVLWLKLVFQATGSSPTVPSFYLHLSPSPLEIRDGSHLYFAQDSALRKHQQPNLETYREDGSVTHVFYIAEPGKERDRFHYAHPIQVRFHPCRLRVEGRDRGSCRLMACDFLKCEPITKSTSGIQYGIWGHFILPKVLSRTKGSLNFNFRSQMKINRFRFQVALPFGVYVLHDDCRCSDNLVHPHLSTNPIISYPGTMPLVSQSGEEREIPIFFNPEPGILSGDGILVYNQFNECCKIGNLP